MAEAVLTNAERARVKAAVAAAETQTIGEIFVVIARASDGYRTVPLVWAMLVALLVPFPLIALTMLPAAMVFAIQLAVFVVLAAVLSVPAARPFCVPAAETRGRAHALAMQQFLAHGLHTTEARTGALIFVSLAERHAEIVADAGIAAKVDQAAWDEAVGALIAEIRNGRLADGLVAAIERVGAVLARHFPPRPRDRDELPNDPILL
jgi:putative membrane protein